MRYHELLSEMAIPAKSMQDQRFYHGTSSTNAADAIRSQGLQGPATQGRSHLAPVQGRVYLTADITYAIMYALGGNFKSQMLEDRHPDDPFGYVFVIDGTDLKDVQPDEDSVGEFLRDNSKPIEQPWKKPNGSIAMKPDGTPFMRTVGYVCSITNDEKGRAIYQFIRSRVTDNQYKKIMDGQYAYYAQGGKRVLKTMPDWMKIELINRGAHIAHGGRLYPSECWRIVKSRWNELKKDGSNFFTIAEKIG